MHEELAKFAKLADYGVNISETMERFVEDEEMYLSCCEEFCSDSCFDSLKSAIENKDYGQVFEHAHTLKGVAGNLGFEPLFKVLCVMVDELRAKEYKNLNELYSSIVSEKNKLDEIFLGKA